MADAVLTDEEKRNLRILAEEVPKLRVLVEELVETLEILGDKKLMRSIKAGTRDVREKRAIGFRKLLAELKIDEKEICSDLRQGVSKGNKNFRQGNSNSNTS